jgi:hypothetical protein
MTEHREPLSQFSLRHGKAAKLFLSTNALTRTKRDRRVVQTITAAP